MRRRENYKFLNKKDIFNGNIKDSRRAVFAYVLINVCIIAAIIYAGIKLAPKTVEYFEHKTITVKQYEVVDDMLKLYVENDPLYYCIVDFDEVLADYESFLELCEKSGRFNAGVTYSGKMKGEPHYRIAFISTEDGTEYMTLEEMQQRNFKEKRKAYIILGIMLFIWNLYVGISIYIGRHPEKFSGKIVKLFFEKDSLNYNSANSEDI